MKAHLTQLYQQESRRVFATLVRLLGNFELAEEAMHDAFVAAAEQWPSQGMPSNPVAWLISTGRFKAIDRLRRDKRFVDAESAGVQLTEIADERPGWEDLAAQAQSIEDDRLRLIFTCCHPSLAEPSRIALTLREVCGLTTEAIASALLLATPTLTQRIVRAKAKIRSARIPYEVPEPDERPSRLASVLRVIYLIFTEGHAAHASALSDEAIRLARLLKALMPEPEVLGLLALLLLHDARRDARSNESGELIALDEQDRTRWDQAAIAEGCKLTEQALSSRGFGVYAIQAAIAAVHAEAPRAEATDWPQIVGLYDALLQIENNPVAALNRAVAIGRRDGAPAGLLLVENLLADLPGYQGVYAAAADLSRRAGQQEKARRYYRQAIELTRQSAQKLWLQRRLAELESPGP